MYKLEFENTEIGRRRYELAFEASQVQPSPSLDKWDTFIDLIKKLKSIGRPNGQRSNNGKIILRELDPDTPCIIFLEKAEHKELLGCIKQPVWPSYALEDAQDLLKWLEGLKHEPGSLTKDAKPNQKKQAEALIAGSIPQANAPETTSTPGNNT